MGVRKLGYTSKQVCDTKTASASDGLHGRRALARTRQARKKRVRHLLNLYPSIGRMITEHRPGGGVSTHTIGQSAVIYVVYKQRHGASSLGLWSPVVLGGGEGRGLPMDMALYWTKRNVHKNTK